MKNVKEQVKFVYENTVSREYNYLIGYDLNGDKPHEEFQFLSLAAALTLSNAEVIGKALVKGRNNITMLVICANRGVVIASYTA